MSWASEEFETIDLGDKRLDKRAVLLAEQFSANATKSIPDACGGWAETRAAYRFVDNPSVDFWKILSPHIQATEQRSESLSGCPVLAGHDNAGLQWQGHRRARTVAVRATAGSSSASDLRCHTPARATGVDRFVALGP